MKNFKMMNLAIVALLTFSVTSWAQDTDDLNADSIVVAPSEVPQEVALDTPSVVTTVTDEVAPPSVGSLLAVENSVSSVVSDCVGCGQSNQVSNGCQGCGSCGGIQQAAVVSPCQGCGQVGLVAYQQPVIQHPVVAPNANSIVTGAPAPYVQSPSMASTVYSTGGPTTSYAQTPSYTPTMNYSPTMNYTPSTNYMPTTGCTNCGTNYESGVSYGNSSFGGRSRVRLGNRVGGRVFRRN